MNQDRDIIASQQFTTEFLDSLFKRATQYKKAIQNDEEIDRPFKGRYMISLFYEPSTRTRFSFELAAKRLGMRVVETESAGMFSSAKKGETLEDTIRVFNEYHPAVIVLRHNEDQAAERAAKVSKAPVINAGDGAGQHPTQALLDLFTIQDKLGKTKNLHIVAGGDLKNGRTIRSLTYLLTKYPGNKFTFVSPPSQRMKDDIKEYLTEKGVEFTESDGINGLLSNADVVYWTRTQKERGSEGENEIILTAKDVKKMKNDAILMHPLPRINEIAIDVDELPQAVYFEQAGNGLFVRMALLEWVCRN